MIALARIFFFKQKTAYEMSVSDWSSDVCSSDLASRGAGALPGDGGGTCRREDGRAGGPKQGWEGVSPRAVAGELEAGVGRRVHGGPARHHRACPGGGGAPGQ